MNDPAQKHPPRDQIHALTRMYAGGRLAEAEQACRTVLKSYPRSSTVLNLLGAVLLNRGKPAQAVKTFDALIRINPDFPQAYSNRGIAFKRLGQFEPAIDSYEKALALKPDSAQTHNNYGNALLEAGRPEPALHALDRAIGLKPDYAEAHNNRGLVLNTLGRTADAVKSYETAIGLKPDYADAFNNKGVSLKNQGKLEAAITALETAIRLKPDFDQAHNNLGVALSELGHLEQAKESYETAIRIRPDYVEAHSNLAGLKKFQTGDPQISRLADVVSRRDLSPKDRITVHFALGKAYTDTGDCASAFQHLTEGNRLRKQALGYDISSDKRVMATLKSAYSPHDPSISLSPEDPPAHRPVFILGMPRSGTTLVEQILASHPMIYGAGELKLLTMAVNKASFSRVTPEVLAAIREPYLAGLTALGKNHPFITDKMPLNFRWIGLIIQALPEAKIIHVKRNPAATCWSIFTRRFTEEGNGYAYNLKDVAEFYNLYRDLMAFWHKTFPGLIYDLEYERLTENQEPETAGLLDYVGVPWDANCLDFHNSSRPVKTASSAQVRQKMYQGSSRQWEKFKPFLGPMMEILDNR